MRAHRNRRNGTRLGVMLVIGLAVCATGAWGQDRGACVNANVPESFTLPDGSAHAPGRITLCTTQALNPVVGLHMLRTTDGKASFAMSERSQSREFDDNRPTLLFHRGPDGALDLVGYVVPLNNKAWRYVLRHSNGKGYGDAAALAAARSKGELITLIASNTR